ncbi:MAG: hypothetical protein E7353_06880 [Clostridiales bacterium]|nr:hypothetical protein [Clostridiales bacterium]
MIIALISIGIIAVCLLLGLLKTALTSLGVNKVAMVIILAVLVGSVFVPYINILGVRFGVAGFILPVIIMGILDFRMGLNREFFLNKLSATIIMAVVLPILLFAFGMNFATTALVTIGISVIVAVIAFMVTKTYSSAVSSVLGGIVVADVVANLIAFFVNGNAILIGSDNVFGLIMISLLMCGVGIQFFASIREKFVSTSVNRRQLSSEEAEENEIDGQYFDEYFTNHNEEK